MGKIFKMISVIMIVAGLAFLFVYTQSQNGSKLDILDQPSYYAARNYWLMFIAGIVVLLFSLLGSFFSWFKEFDTKEEILPNAGYASDQEIRTWVGGTSADMDEAETGAGKSLVVVKAETENATEVMRDGVSDDIDATELLQNGASDKADKTSIIGGRERT